MKQYLLLAVLILFVLTLPNISAYSDSEWFFASDETENATASTNFLPKLRLTWLPSEVGDWLVLVSYEIQSNSTINSVQAQVQLDDYSVIGDSSQESAGALDYWAVSHMKVLQNLSIAQHEIEIKWRSLNGNDIARIKNARIQLIRIDDELNIDYYYAESEGNSTTTTDYSDKVAINATPSSAGEYILLGNVELDASSGGEGKMALARIKANNDLIPIAVGGSSPRADKYFSAKDSDATDHFVFNYFGVLNFTSVQNNLSVQVAHQGVDPYIAFHGRLLLFRLADVYEFNYVLNESEINTTSNLTYENISILEFNPDVEQDYFILQSMGYTGSSSGKTGEVAFMQNDEKISNSTFTVKNISDYFVSTSYAIKNFSTSPQCFSNSLRVVDQPIAFAKFSNILLFRPSLRGKLIISRFSTSLEDFTRHVFLLEVKNNITEVIPNIDWTIGFQGNRIQSTQEENLIPNETMHIFIENNFSNSGDVLIRARVTNTTRHFWDRKFLLISAGEELDLLNLTSLTSDTNKVFRFLISSIWNTDRIADWTLDTGESEISSSSAQLLEPNQNYSIFVEYDYEDKGFFDVEATANTSRSADSENISIFVTEVDVSELINLTSGVRQVFRFYVTSLASTEKPAEWEINTGEIIINSSEPELLQGDETFSVFVEYNYTGAGEFEINASANITESTDSEKITITI